MLTAMAHSGVAAVSEVVGTPVHAGQVVSVPVAEALGAGGMMINRSQLSVGSDLGALLTIVPASGLVSGSAALDAVKLTDALVTGAAAGIASAGGPLFQALSAQLVTSPAELDLRGAQAFAFDLVAGSKSITVLWVVEATLGSLLGGSIPVDEPTGEGPSVAPAALPDIGRVGTVGASKNIRSLSDVMAKVSVEIARGTVQVKDLVDMGPGSVFELDREAGDAVDVLVNGSMIARGDIIVVGNQLGVRISKVCEPEQ
jgi:flagellar motor switch protein FliN/FliY